MTKQQMYFALSAIFAILSAILAIKGINGWGWFLFIAFLCLL